MHNFFTIMRCRIALQQNDPRWVGAWWIGFLVFMIPTLLVAPVFFGYPADPSASLYFLFFSVQPPLPALLSIHKQNNNYLQHIGPRKFVRGSQIYHTYVNCRINLCGLLWYSKRSSQPNVERLINECIHFKMFWYFFTFEIVLLNN